MRKLLSLIFNQKWEKKKLAQLWKCDVLVFLMDQSLLLHDIELFLDTELTLMHKQAS